MPSRGVHSRPARGTAAYRQGKSQADISIKRYHWLCAYILNQFSLFDTPADPSLGQMFPRKGIDFSQYHDFNLEPITGVKLCPRADGSIHPGDLASIHTQFRLSWKMREGGILYAIGDYGDFGNCMLNYHSPSGTTGNADWDVLFAKLKLNGFSKAIIPCMFFGRAAGCLDGDCPFLHDRDSSEGVLASRAAVVADRRATFARPPANLHCAWERKKMAEYRHNHGEPPDSLLDSLSQQAQQHKAYCANPACARPWVGAEDCPLQACARCKHTLYCSPECQRGDWKRHKKEPCATIDVLIEDDELWSPLGTRKGTEFFTVDWGRA